MSGEDKIIESLAGMSAIDLIQWILAIMLIISLIVTTSIQVYKWIERYRKMKNDTEEKKELLMQNTEDIEKLRHNHDEDIQMLKEDYQFIKDHMNETDKKIDDVFNMLIEQRKHDDDNSRARIKDRIAQSYRFYKAEGKWTNMDKESLEGLIASYEACGGHNSFVHDTVLKEMYEWEIID